MLGDLYNSDPQRGQMVSAEDMRAMMNSLWTVFQASATPPLHVDISTAGFHFWMDTDNPDATTTGTFSVYRPACGPDGILRREVSVISVANGVFTQSAWVFDKSLCVSCGCATTPPATGGAICPDCTASSFAKAYCVAFPGVGGDIGGPLPLNGNPFTTGGCATCLTGPQYLPQVNSGTIFPTKCFWGQFNPLPLSGGCQTVVSFACINGSWVVRVVVGDVLIAYYSVYNPTWNGLGSLTLTGGGIVGVGCATWPSTVTVSACTGAPQYPLNTPIRTNLGTAQAWNSQTVTSNIVNVDSGQLLVVVLNMVVATGLPSGPTVTFNGNGGSTTLTKRAFLDDTPGAGTYTAVYAVTGVSGPGTIKADAGAGGADYLVSIYEVSGLTNTLDKTKTNSGQLTQPDTGASAATATAIEYAGVVWGMIGPFAAAQGIPGNNFGTGQTLQMTTTLGKQLLLRDDYQILQRTQAVDAIVGWTQTFPARWAGALVTFS